MSAAQTGRTHDLHPTASRKPKESLDPWAPSTHDPSATCSPPLRCDSRHYLGTPCGGPLKFQLGRLPKLAALSPLITVLEQLTHISGTEAAGLRFWIVGIDRGQVEFPVSAFRKLVGGK